jgi:hypothetical protein
MATGWWFSPGTPISSTNKTDRHDITEILLTYTENNLFPHLTISPSQFSFALEILDLMKSVWHVFWFHILCIN